MNTAQLLAKYLLDIKAIKLQPNTPFTWASGMLSPIYCDNRMTLSYPEVRNFVKKELSNLAKSMGEFDGIAGVATAGIAHGALVADELGLPFIYVRSKAKGHGRQNLIEGNINAAKNYVVVEDLISTGGSSIQAVNALKDQGVNVAGTIALFTYEFTKSIQAFEEANCKFATLSNYSTMLEQAQINNYITSKEKQILNNWNADPKAWAASFSK
jgi:orotate phosphoribosyltransferase